jgi:uncharacterized protein YkwD
MQDTYETDFNDFDGGNFFHAPGVTHHHNIHRHPRTLQQDDVITPEPDPNAGYDPNCVSITEAEFINMNQVTIDHINDNIRTPNGLDPLLFNWNLAIASLRHSCDMAKRTYFSHIAPEPAPFGSSPQERIESAEGINGSPSEGLARFQFFNGDYIAMVSLFHREWLSLGSPTTGDMGHYGPYLSPNTKYIGFGHSLGLAGYNYTALYADNSLLFAATEPKIPEMVDTCTCGYPFNQFTENYSRVFESYTSTPIFENSFANGEFTDPQDTILINGQGSQIAAIVRPAITNAGTGTFTDPNHYNQIKIGRSFPIDATEEIPVDSRIITVGIELVKNDFSYMFGDFPGPLAVQFNIKDINDNVLYTEQRTLDLTSANNWTSVEFSADVNFDGLVTLYPVNGRTLDSGRLPSLDIFFELNFIGTTLSCEPDYTHPDFDLVPRYLSTIRYVRISDFTSWWHKTADGSRVGFNPFNGNSEYDPPNGIYLALGDNIITDWQISPAEDTIMTIRNIDYNNFFWISPNTSNSAFAYGSSRWHVGQSFIGVFQDNNANAPLLYHQDGVGVTYKKHEGTSMSIQSVPSHTNNSHYTYLFNAFNLNNNLA